MAEYLYPTDCSAICHPKCIPNLPADCGVPSEYYKYMVDARACIHRRSISSEPEKAALQIQLSGFLKMLRFCWLSHLLLVL